MNLAYANGFLLVLVLIELVLIRAIKKEHIPWKEVVFNLNSGHIILWISRGLQIAGFHFVLTQSSIKLFDDWNYLSQFIFTFLAWIYVFIGRTDSTIHSKFSGPFMPCITKASILISLLGSETPGIPLWFLSLFSLF